MSTTVVTSRMRVVQMVVYMLVFCAFFVFIVMMSMLFFARSAMAMLKVAFDGIAVGVCQFPFTFESVRHTLVSSYIVNSKISCDHLPCGWPSFHGPCHTLPSVHSTFPCPMKIFQLYTFSHAPETLWPSGYVMTPLPFVDNDDAG